jgi:ATP-dependent DNA helicase DinG
MSLILDVEQAFAPDGRLAGAEEHFVSRPGQKRMAAAVAQAIEKAYPLVIEASTGVGKTYSYLVPALLSGERVLVSTATKALQDQLYGRDLPRLISVLGLPVQTALLKGRASYLCLQRLETARQDPHVSQSGSLRALGRIEQWASSTRTGDMAELDGLDERSPLIALVTSTRENCLGAPCPHFKACHVNHARREALAADVVVINHHLFFADLAVRESGMAELLPTVRIAIFDEAHQLNETGIQFLGRNFTTGQLLDFSRDVLASGLQHARGLAEWQVVAGGVEQAARMLRMAAGRQLPGSKLRWTGGAPDGLDASDWDDALAEVQRSCLQAGEALALLQETSADFARLRERALILAEQAELFVHACEQGCVRWLDVGAQLRLIESPLNIEKAMRTRILPAAEGMAKTWIFTSATLGDDDRLSWFTEPCGLGDAQVLRIGSPFNYERQAAFYVPPDFLKPGDPAHSLAVARSAATWVRALGGRTMILTTTLRAVRVIGDALSASFNDSLDIEVLVQGSMPKRRLIERFRRGASEGEKACVLVASASFWEGIDFPGDVLQLVIIDKLPFPPPNDPLVEARTKLLESQGRSPFTDYFLPEAAVALKQGAGRLIRRESDEGVLVVCDNRLISMSYGRRLLKALPLMQRIATEQQLMDRLQAFTKTCTKDSLQA